MNHVLVSDIMTRQVICINPDTNLLDCAKTLLKKKIASAPLVEDKKIKGFISIRDILWAMVKKSRSDLSKIKALDISPRKLITLRPEATVEDAARRIKKFKFHRFPVVKNGELVGILSLKDIVTFYPEINPQLKEFEDIKEEAEKMERLEGAKERVAVRDGICEECGARGQLYRMNGMLVCASCISSG